MSTASAPLSVMAEEYVSTEVSVDDVNDAKISNEEYQDGDFKYELDGENAVFAFSNCKSLVEINFPENMTIIGKAAFNGCTSITSLNIPDSVQVIESYAFSGCDILKSVKLPANLTKIQEATFFYDSNLKKVFIPATVTSIEKLAFSTSGNEEKFDIYYAGSEEQWKSITIGDPNKKLSVAKLHYNSTLDD